MKVVYVDDYDVTHEAFDGQPRCGLLWTDDDGFPGAEIVFDQIVPEDDRVWCERCSPRVIPGVQAEDLCQHTCGSRDCTRPKGYMIEYCEYHNLFYPCPDCGE